MPDIRSSPSARPRPGAQEFRMQGHFPRMGRVLTGEEAIGLLQHPETAPARS